MSSKVGIHEQINLITWLKFLTHSKRLNDFCKNITAYVAYVMLMLLADEQNVRKDNFYFFTVAQNSPY